MKLHDYIWKCFPTVSDMLTTLLANFTHFRLPSPSHTLTISTAILIYKCTVYQALPIFCLFLHQARLAGGNTMSSAG